MGDRSSPSTIHLSNAIAVRRSVKQHDALWSAAPGHVENLGFPLDTVPSPASFVRTARAVGGSESGGSQVDA